MSEQVRIKEAMETMNKRAREISEFEAMRNMAELKALSNVSLERELTDFEFERMQELKTKVFGRMLTI